MSAISPSKPGSGALQPIQSSIVKLMKQFRIINGPSGVCCLKGKGQVKEIFFQMFLEVTTEWLSEQTAGSCSKEINQSNFKGPISPVKPCSMVRQLSQCSTAKSRILFRNGPSGMPVSTEERPSQRDVSSYVS